MRADSTTAPEPRVSDSAAGATRAPESLEAALVESELRYRALFEETRDAIYITRPDGSFIDVNPSFLDLFGYSREELWLLGAQDLYAEPQDRSRFRHEIETRRAVRDFELRLKTRDGRVLDCLLSSAIHCDADGNLLWYQGIVHDITARKRTEEQLLHNAFHDALTGLPNRALFLDRLEQLIHHAHRNPAHGFAVLFLDLDRFKLVNDSLGHGVGDELLIAIARRLQTCVLTGDTVARLGGDEFAILLDEVKDVNDAIRAADRIEKALQEPFTVGGHEVFTAASIGIALSATGYTRPEEVLRDADTAMYRAKNGGRGLYEVFDRTMHSQAVEQLELETDLRRALEREEFVLHYQPIVSLEASELAGFEALVRWQHPRNGLVMPGGFIAVAEETGIIVPLGWIVLRAACAQMAQWLYDFPFAQRMTVSVNLSSRQFAQPDLVPQIDRILGETRCPPANLKLEITESTIMQNPAQAADMLRQLRARGINLCIDDFGTGYSSLSYLNSFPIDTLKIDRSFIHKIDEDSSTVDLIETIVALSRVLGMSAVAEGIETPEQLELVRRLGSQMAQGYYLSMPVTAEEAGRVLAEGIELER